MNKIVILAAGKGTRMGGGVPKVLVPLKGKPMIIHLLDSIKSSGVDSQPIVVSSPSIIDQTKKALDGYDVIYALQGQQLGTGHALASACDVIPHEATSIITLYGDHPLIRPSTVIDLIRRHDNAESPVTLMTVEAGSFDTWPNFMRWGRIIREKNRIKGIVEYKDANEEQRLITEVNPAIYAFDKKWVCDNLSFIKANNAQGEYYLTDMVKIAFDQGHEISSTLMSPEESIGVNTPDELAIAEKTLP